MPQVMGTVAQPMLSATQNGSSVSQHIRKRDVCLAAAATAVAAAAEASSVESYHGAGTGKKPKYHSIHCCNAVKAATCTGHSSMMQHKHAMVLHIRYSTAYV
jgi:hypothetical protein